MCMRVGAWLCSAGLHSGGRTYVRISESICRAIMVLILNADNVVSTWAGWLSSASQGVRFGGAEVGVRYGWVWGVPSMGAGCVSTGHLRMRTGLTGVGARCYGGGQRTEIVQGGHREKWGVVYL